MGAKPKSNRPIPELEQLNATLLLLVKYAEGTLVDSLIQQGHTKEAFGLLRRSARLARIAGDRELGKSLDSRLRLLVKTDNQVKRIFRQPKRTSKVRGRAIFSR